MLDVEFLEKIDFEQNLTTKKHAKLPSSQKVNIDISDSLSMINIHFQSKPMINFQIFSIIQTLMNHRNIIDS